MAAENHEGTGSPVRSKPRPSQHGAGCHLGRDGGFQDRSNQVANRLASVIASSICAAEHRPTCRIPVRPGRVRRQNADDSDGQSRSGLHVAFSTDPPLVLQKAAVHEGCTGGKRPHDKRYAGEVEGQTVG
ncbi:hypothetical protein M8818_001464 [Zalaria obscura]|uniref:Uncharacterized protein n=1 Tax=Zalaria obscura TaxID=2024903 RepID=A0ACC3SJU7_9PEZI